jgi:hypothetical protein
LFKKTPHFWISLASLLAGLALFVYLVHRTGPGRILDQIEQFGWFFGLVLLISGVRQLLRTLSWHFSLEPEYRRIPLWRLFNIRLMGEAITDLTFAGPLLGEPMKALAASRQLPATVCLSSIAVENLVFSVSVVVFLLTGVWALLFHAALPGEMRLFNLLATLALIIPALLSYLAIRRDWKILSWTAYLAGRFQPTWEARLQLSARVGQVEERLYTFVGENRRLFLFILLLELATHCCGVAEAWLILRATTGETSLLAALLVESAYRVVNVVFAFVPLRLGVDESGTALTLKALGPGGGAGVSLAIIRKIRILFWMAVGLALLGRHALQTHKGRKP